MHIYHTWYKYSIYIIYIIYIDSDSVCVHRESQTSGPWTYSIIMYYQGPPHLGVPSACAPFSAGI